MKIEQGLTALILLFAASPIFAETATSAQAERLVALFQSYLGAEPGVVTVTPEGESYTLTLDAAPYMAKAAGAGFTGSMTPLVMELSDQGDGTWLITQDQALELKATVPGQFDLLVSIGSLSGSSVFDEKLKVVTSGTTEFSDVVVNQTVTAPDGPAMQVAYTLEEGDYTSTAVASAVAGVDTTATLTATGLHETMTQPGFDGTPMDIAISAGSYKTEAVSAGLRPEAIYGLIGWFVAHPSEAAIMADQAGLKAVLTAGLPLFDSLSGTGTVETIDVTTPFGVINIAGMGFGVAMNGIVADGMFSESIGITGLTLPDGLVPDWAVGLVPDSLDLDFRVAGFNLADPARMFIDAFDLAGPEPVKPEVGMALLAALLPTGGVTISMEGGNVTAPLYGLTVTGGMVAGPGVAPTGQATVTATGFDAAMAAVNGAPVEINEQVAPAMIVAKGMAKAETDGTLVWQIDGSQPGKLLVNGVDVMAMGGGN